MMKPAKGLIVACAFCLATGILAPAYAQDDVDNLLNDLEGNGGKDKAAEAPKQVAPSPAPMPAPTPEAPKAVEPVPAPVKAVEPAPAKVDAEPAPAPVKKDEVKKSGDAVPAAVPAKEDAKAEIDNLLQDVDDTAKPAATPKAAEPAPAVVEPVAPAAVEPAPAAVETPKAEEPQAVTPKAEEPKTATPAAVVVPQAVEPSIYEEAKNPAKAPAAAGAAPAAAVKPAAPLGPDAALISELAAAEALRRKSFDNQARHEILAAQNAMAVRDYETAFKQYKLAQSHLNDSTENAEAMKISMASMTPDTFSTLP